MGALDIVLAVVLLAGVWLALPVRWWPVDVGFTLLALALLAAGVGLYQGAAWGARVGRAVAASTLVTGAALATTLAFTAAGLAGLYGPVGSGGAIILVVAAFLVLPYLIVFPAAQLYFLLPARDADEAAAPPGEGRVDEAAAPVAGPEAEPATVSGMRERS